MTVRRQEDQPDTAADCPFAVVASHVRALSHWFSVNVTGMVGGAVRAATMALRLIPGQLIGLDEWTSSPVTEGSNLPPRSGTAMRCDVIPNQPLNDSNRMEDGYPIADDKLQDERQRLRPGLVARGRLRRDYMGDRIGLDVPDALSPLSDTCANAATRRLKPRQVICL